METVNTDYLVIGCGAVGMAFVDTILAESDARVMILDERTAPGGHWNDAYPFVTLHQPSAFYGVASTELSRGRIDNAGLNRGMMELATGAEVRAYFERVMRERFLPSGRVDFRPLTRWEDDGHGRDLVTGERFAVAAKKVVDGAYLGTNIPALHTPSFSVEPGATMIPVNELPRHVAGAEDFVIIGGGKTAMDAVIWLLGNRVAPERIRWVRNRDSYLMNRAKTQPGEAFFAETFGGQLATFEAMGAASDPDDLLDRLEAANVLFRLDPDVRPKMFHGATISEAELAQLRRVKNVIRMGHVRRVGVEEVDLDQGAIPATAKTVHVDCSACAVTRRPPVKVFDGDRITLQMIRIFQPTFSGSLIAWLDVHYDDEKAKNRLSSPSPLPDRATDWIKVNVATMMNQFNWSQDKALRAWMTENRLDGFSRLARSVDPEDAEKIEILTRMREAARPAMTNGMKLLAMAG